MSRYQVPNRPAYDGGSLNLGDGSNPTPSFNTTFGQGGRQTSALSPREDLKRGDFQRVDQDLVTSEAFYYYFDPERIMSILHFLTQSMDTWHFRFARPRRRRKTTLTYFIRTVNLEEFDDAPNQKTPRFITHYEEQHEQKMVRFNQGARFDPVVLADPQLGPELFQLRMRQIYNNWAATSKVLICGCIPDATNYWAKYTLHRAEPFRDVSLALAKETQNFGGFAKDDKHLPRMLSTIQADAKAEGVNFNVILFPHKGVADSVRYNNYMTKYDNVGGTALTNLKSQGNNLSSMTGGLTIMEDEIIRFENSRQNHLDFLRSITEIGQYHVDDQNRYDACDVKPGKKNTISIYNAASDSMEEIDKRMLVVYSGIFDPQTGELSSETDDIINNLSEKLNLTQLKLDEESPVVDPYVYVVDNSQAQSPELAKTHFLGQQQLEVSSIDVMESYVALARRNILTSTNIDMAAIEEMLRTQENLATPPIDTSNPLSPDYLSAVVWPFVCTQYNLRRTQAKPLEGIDAYVEIQPNEFDMCCPSLPKVVETAAGRAAVPIPNTNNQLFFGVVFAGKNEVGATGAVQVAAGPTGAGPTDEVNIDDLNNEFNGIDGDTDTDALNEGDIVETTNQGSSQDQPTGTGNGSSNTGTGNGSSNTGAGNGSLDTGDGSESFAQQVIEAQAPGRDAETLDAGDILTTSPTFRIVAVEADSDDLYTPPTLPYGFSTVVCADMFRMIGAKKMVKNYWSAPGYSKNLQDVCDIMVKGCAQKRVLCKALKMSIADNHLLCDPSFMPSYLQTGDAETDSENALFISCFDKSRFPIMVPHQQIIPQVAISSRVRPESQGVVFEDIKNNLARLFKAMNNGNDVSDQDVSFYPAPLPLAADGTASLMPTEYSTGGYDKRNKAAAKLAQALRVGYRCVSGDLLVLLGMPEGRVVTKNTKTLKRIQRGLQLFSQSKALEDFNARTTSVSDQADNALEYLYQISKSVSGQTMDGHTASLTETQRTIVKSERIAALFSNFVTLIMLNKYDKMYQTWSDTDLQKHIMKDIYSSSTDSRYQDLPKNYETYTTYTSRGEARGFWTNSHLSYDTNCFNMFGQRIKALAQAASQTGNISSLLNYTKRVLSVPMRPEHPGKENIPITTETVLDYQLNTGLRVDNNGELVGLTKRDLYLAGKLSAEQIRGTLNIPEGYGGAAQAIQESETVGDAFSGVRVVKESGTLTSSLMVRYHDTESSHETAPDGNYLASMDAHLNRQFGGPRDSTGGTGRHMSQQEANDVLNSLPSKLGKIATTPVGQYIDQDSKWRYHSVINESMVVRLNQIKTAKDAISRALIMIYCYMPIHLSTYMRTIETCNRHHTNYLIARPRIRLRMGWIMLFEESENTAEFAYNLEHDNISYNGPRDTTVLHVITHAVAFVKDYKRMILLPNKIFSGYLGGMDTTINNWDNFNARSELRDSSMLVFDIGANATLKDLPNPLDLTGRYNFKGKFTQPIHNNLRDANFLPQYPSAIRYATKGVYPLYKLHGDEFSINANSYKTYTESSPQTTLCFRGYSEHYNPTAPNSPHIVHSSGHLDEDCYPGYVKVLNGDSHFRTASMK